MSECRTNCWSEQPTSISVALADHTVSLLSGRLDRNPLDSLDRSGDLVYFFPKLEHLDISANDFSGHADVLRFPALKYADLSHNKFTTAGFRRFQEAYRTLREVDLSSNRIAQDVSHIFHDIPPTLRALDLSHNFVGGALPKDFPIEGLRSFLAANNSLTGVLPNFLETSPKLNVLDLTRNKLIGTIPASLGDLTQLNTLKLSSNSLSKSIPVKLGRLKGRWSSSCIRFKYVSNTNLESNCKFDYWFRHVGNI